MNIKSDSQNPIDIITFYNKVYIHAAKLEIKKIRSKN